MTGIGRYRIETAIGEGAMAVVWRAFDPAVGRRVAIKTLRPELACRPGSVDRFLREARAAGALSHPNIVTIFDVGDEVAQPHIAMELLEGETLDCVLAARGRLSARETLQVGVQLADALDYAHAAGVIHRDIKPANIMLCGEQVRVLDFGIARVTDPDPSDVGAETMRTQFGDVLGTPRYMSPEQALGQPLDGRSDLFSVGAVLYELITGRTAFSATTIASLAVQIVRDPPEPLARCAPECPPGVRRIIEKLMEKSPERRFANGGALAAALRREEATLRGRKAARPRRYWPLTIQVAAIAAVSLAAVLIPAATWLIRAQDTALEALAASSGRSMASFVASNAALKAAENSGLPSDAQDWLAVQSFVDAAIRDASARHIIMSDRDGIVRVTDRSEFRGQQRDRVRNAITDGRDLLVSAPIVYSGRDFGLVDVAINTTQLKASQAAVARRLTIAIVAVLLAAVAFGYAVAAYVARRVRAVAAAIDRLAANDTAVRLSGARHLELRAVHDAFNRLATLREAVPTPRQDADPCPDATRIAPAANREAA